MKLTKKVDSVLKELAKLYPDAICGLAYDKTPYKLVIATILSAQTTDKSVNKVTPKLWESFPSLIHLAEAEQKDVEEVIKSIGLYRNKSKFIINAAAHMAIHGIPDSIIELVKIPGVGRKTANVVLGEIHGKPSITVDTHMIRLTNRLGLVCEKNPVKIEKILKSIIPLEEQTRFSHRIISHGRSICSARKPNCTECTLSEICVYKKNGNL